VNWLTHGKENRYACRQVALALSPLLKAETSKSQSIFYRKPEYGQGKKFAKIKNYEPKLGD
jgi:hypothetical protein